VDKLRDLHTQLDKGVTPKAGYAHYTVRQAAQDWLAQGLDGLSVNTITKNQNVLEPILKVIGARKLRDLTAADVRQALAAMAAGYSTAAVSMGHLALKRAIRHAEANDLISRNVAALADTPKGQQGRPSKSLTLDQAVAVITAARTLPVMELQPGLKDVRRPAELMYAYITLSLPVRDPHRGSPRAALGARRPGRRPVRPSARPAARGRVAIGPHPTARPRPSGPAAPLAFPWRRSRRCVPGPTARLMSGSWPMTDGRTPGWCSRTTWALRWTQGTSGRCSNASAPRPGSGTAGHPASCGPRLSA